jgi:hypothetical protein
VVSAWRRPVVAAQALYYVVTGLWPLIHLRSFEAVTGPKTDDWLVHTVGLLAAAIGTSLGTAVVRRQTQGAVVSMLATTSAFAFAGIDLRYGLSGAIAPIYLADSAVQLGLIALLVLTRVRQPSSHELVR